jgi:hypothetical protein
MQELCAGSGLAAAVYYIQLTCFTSTKVQILTHELCAGGGLAAAVY